MSNPFISQQKPMSIANSSNPFFISSNTTINPINSTNQGPAYQSPITNYFPQTSSGNQAGNANSVPSPFSINTNTNTNTTNNNPLNLQPLTQLGISSNNPFMKASDIKNSNMSTNANGVYPSNPFLSNTSTNNTTSSYAGLTNQNSQSNQFNGPGNNTYGTSTNSINTNPFTVNSNNNNTGQQFNNFIKANQISNTGSFNTTSNNNNNPFPTNTTGQTANTFINTINSTNTNQYNTSNSNTNTNTNNTNFTLHNPFTNTSNSNNNTNVFQINPSTSSNTINTTNNTFNPITSSNNPFQPNNAFNTTNTNTINTTNTNNNQPIGFVPSFNVNNTSAFQLPQSNTTNPTSSSSSVNPFSTNQTNSNPFSIQQSAQQQQFTSSIITTQPFTSTYPTNSAFLIPYPQPQPQTQQQHQQNTYPYPNYSQLPYDLQYAPIYINQSYNYNHHYSSNQAIEEIESKYLTQYINNSIINKEREQQEKLAQERKDINSIIKSHYDENPNMSYFLPSSYNCAVNNYRGSDNDPSMPDYNTLPQLNYNQINRKKKQAMIAATQNKIMLRPNSRYSSIKPFKLPSSNSQSTIQKQYSTSNLSQSSMSSISTLNNYQYEVTITFEQPIRLVKVIKTRRYLVKDNVIKDIIERFNERRVTLTANDFVLLINGIVIGSEIKQIDLSTQAFSFSETDSNVKKISIAGHVFSKVIANDMGQDAQENNKEQHIQSRSPNNNTNNDIHINEDDNDNDDGFDEVKDDYYPKTTSFITTPPIEQLNTMSKEQLQNVHNFSIANSYGKLLFDQPCDLTYVNLDSITIESYCLIKVKPNDIFIDKLRMSCTADFFNILIDETSPYQISELKRICEVNLRSNNIHYAKPIETLTVKMDLSKL